MEIGAIIKKYRKEKDMTQEEMAKYLGVTASAVNKWENNNAYPDIMLLAPIARLLDISLDILLSYHEKLTVQEINSMIAELNAKLETEVYPEVFAWAKSKIEKYPYSGELIWQMGMVLDAWRVVKRIPVTKEYDEYIMDCYERVLKSDDEKLRISAADAMFSLCMRKEEYEKAEKYLSYYSDQNPEKKCKMASLYSKTGRREEAYRTYEELLFYGHNILNIVLSNIYLLEIEEKNMSRAHMLADKLEGMERLFDMGRYYEVSNRLMLTTAEQDVDGTVNIMKEMLDNLYDLGSWSNSPLFEHMDFKASSEEFYERTRQGLLKCFRDEETFGYLKGNEWWDELIKGKEK